MKKRKLQISEKVRLLTMLIASVFFVLFITNNNSFICFNSTNSSTKVDVVTDIDDSFQVSFEEEDFERGYKAVQYCRAITFGLLPQPIKKASVLQVLISEQLKNKSYMNSDLAPPSRFFL